MINKIMFYAFYPLWIVMIAFTYAFLNVLVERTPFAYCYDGFKEFAGVK